ncbi:hypothetical protein ACW95P_01820 [Candidatus Mycoplasma pogonae]
MGKQLLANTRGIAKDLKEFNFMESANAFPVEYKLATLWIIFAVAWALYIFIKWRKNKTNIRGIITHKRAVVFIVTFTIIVTATIILLNGG